MKREIYLPDEFTEEQVKECLNMVAVQVHRILERPMIPAEEKVMEYKVKMDTFLSENKMPRKFPDVQLPSKDEVVEAEAVEEDDAQPVEVKP